jgi:hypothetical protein
MKFGRILLLIAANLIAIFPNARAADPDFSGNWRLDVSRSRIHAQHSPTERLNIEHAAPDIRCALRSDGTNPTPVWLVRTDGRESRSKIGENEWVTIAKWEGAALLVNTIVRKPRGQYTDMQRWRRSRDGSTLTIRRDIVDARGESESVLVYAKE